VGCHRPVNSDDIEWGTVGEWFSGTGGLLAVAVALGFGIAEHGCANAERTARDESERQAAEHDLRNRAALLRVMSGGASSVVGPGANFGYHLRSMCDFSFRDVEVIAEWPDGITATAHIPAIGPMGEAANS
jgi:hypothetical protein